MKAHAVSFHSVSELFHKSLCYLSLISRLKGVNLCCLLRNGTGNNRVCMFMSHFIFLKIETFTYM